MKQRKKFEQMTDEERNDLRLLLLMRQNDSEDLVSEEEIFKILDE
ncbi:MAG TPA: hypothetical protein VLO29_01610 [Salegentibacter sp.]|nr:hypothetical protein [Salegentibacter sp.]